MAMDPSYLQRIKNFQLNIILSNNISCISFKTNTERYGSYKVVALRNYCMLKWIKYVGTKNWEMWTTAAPLLVAPQSLQLGPRYPHP